ncbi:MAG TPA: hypothetical protein VE130_10590 [Nitrososphaeraceae archaeon]|nr:hypothetical protein [Nitrososphaeraceae archaeon]
MSISLVMKWVVIILSIIAAAVTLTQHWGTAYANQITMKSEVLEEIRENLMEVRLALQKGDLIEALQHLNNADEDLLLEESGSQPASTKSPYGDSSNSEPLTNDTLLSVSKDSANNKISNATSIGSENPMRKLNITFNSIFVNNNHDILFPAEWKLVAYVNNKSIYLSDNPNMDRVESGERIDFKDKSIVIDVLENSTLRIVSVGVELDDGVIDGEYKNNMSGAYTEGDNTGILPDITGILDTESPLPEYRNKLEDSVQFLTIYDRNDAIGIIVAEYNARSNFGIGDHSVCSESTGEVGDIFDTVDTNCDYRLFYTIEDV